jgi:hypothetical protein
MTSQSTLLGAAGEHLVMSELLRRNFIAALAPAGAPNVDIIVTDIKGDRLWSVQVKTRCNVSADSGWYMNAKHENIEDDRLYYCFVDFGEKLQDKPEVFVVPSAEVAKVLRESHQRWLNTPGPNGQTHKDSPLRRLLHDYTRLFGTEGNPYRAGWLKHYHNAWPNLEPQNVEALGRMQMDFDRDEVGNALKRMASSDQQRGHATWFHTPSEFQSAKEEYIVAQWAQVMNERRGWHIREIRRNPSGYPDCLADFGPEAAKRLEVVGIEVTELVDRDAIHTHRQASRLATTGRLAEISDGERLELLERMEPEWSLDKFKERLEARVRDKDGRSRDRRSQFLLIVTDESLDEDTLAQYLGEVLLPRPRNFDAVYLMRSAATDGHYPVFEVPLSDDQSGLE